MLGVQKDVLTLLWCNRIRGNPATWNGTEVIPGDFLEMTFQNHFLRPKVEEMLSLPPGETAVSAAVASRVEDGSLAVKNWGLTLATTKE